MNLLSFLFIFSQYLNTNLFLNNLIVLNTRNDLDFSLPLEGFDTRYDGVSNKTGKTSLIKLNLLKKKLLDILNNDNIPINIKLNKLEEYKWLFINNNNHSLIENSDFYLEDFQ